MQAIDIIEQNIADLSLDLLEILLVDKTTKKYIRWATDNYVSLGEDYEPDQEIKPQLIIGAHTNVIQPRVAKSRDEQLRRTKDKAEVFTPSWICNEQNNLIDTQWFGRENVFNHQKEHDWIENKEKITFPEDKSWQQYVDARRLEMSCGEAPYLVSRYDTVSGQMIPVNKRIGLLDRKLRIVSENCDSEEDWFKWAIRAYQATYAFEYQGDNTLLARENLLFTFSDYLQDKFGKSPSLAQLKIIANIIAWNIWQMDGLNFTTPYSKAEPKYQQMSIFDFINTDEDSPNEINESEAMFSLIRDWRAEKSLEYKSLLERR